MQSLEAERRFRSMYEAQARPLLGYAVRRVAVAEDAADVVAETFLVAWRRIDDVPDGREARPWLYGVAHRVIANQRRGGLRRDRLGLRLRIELNEVAPDWASMSTTGLVVRQALAELSDLDRELLQLTNWEGLSAVEIALVVGVPAATVRTRLHRSRMRLRDQLEAIGWPGDGDEHSRPAGHVGVDECPLVPRGEDRS